MKKLAILILLFLSPLVHGAEIPLDVTNKEIWACQGVAASHLRIIDGDYAQVDRKLSNYLITYFELNGDPLAIVEINGEVTLAMDCQKPNPLLPGTDKVCSGSIGRSIYFDFESRLGGYSDIGNTALRGVNVAPILVEKFQCAKF